MRRSSSRPEGGPTPALALMLLAAAAPAAAATPRPLRSPAGSKKKPTCGGGCGGGGAAALAVRRVLLWTGLLGTSGRGVVRIHHRHGRRPLLPGEGPPAAVRCHARQRRQQRRVRAAAAHHPFAFTAPAACILPRTCGGGSLGKGVDLRRLRVSARPLRHRLAKTRLEKRLVSLRAPMRVNKQRRARHAPRTTTPGSR